MCTSNVRCKFPVRSRRNIFGLENGQESMYHVYYVPSESPKNINGDCVGKSNRKIIIILENQSY